MPTETTRCSMCETQITSEQWRALPSVGLQEDGDGGWLDLRNHGCGSTLARPLSTLTKAAS